MQRVHGTVSSIVICRKNTPWQGSLQSRAFVGLLSCREACQNKPSGESFMKLLCQPGKQSMRTSWSSNVLHSEIAVSVTVPRKVKCAATPLCGGHLFATRLWVAHLLLGQLRYATATKYSVARMTRRVPRSFNMARYFRCIVPKTLWSRRV
jgi:hypothetical protein